MPAKNDFDNMMDMYFQQNIPKKEPDEPATAAAPAETAAPAGKGRKQKKDSSTEQTAVAGRGGRKPYVYSDGTPPVRLNTKLYNGNYEYCLARGMAEGIKPCNAISYYINRLIDEDKKKHPQG